MERYHAIKRHLLCQRTVYIVSSLFSYFYGDSPGGGGISLASYTLPDGTVPSVLLDFENALYYVGTTPTTPGAQLTGTLNITSRGLAMPGDNSIQAQAALLSAMALTSTGATVACVVDGGNQQVYQFPLTMGTNAFIYFGAQDTPQAALCFSSASSSRLTFAPSNFTSVNFFASGYSTVSPKRSAIFNGQAGQQDDNGYDVASPVYVGWYTGGSFPGQGFVRRIVIYPKRLTATQLPQLRTLAPFNTTPRSSLLVPNTGSIILPNGALFYERTQPWSFMASIASAYANAPFGGVAFTNTITDPFSGMEGWIEGTNSGRAAGLLCIRLMHDLGAGNAIDLSSSFQFGDGKQPMSGGSYAGNSLAAGVKIYKDGISDPSIAVALNALTASILTNSGALWIGNQTNGGFGGNLFSFFAFYNTVKPDSFFAAHASYGTLPDPSDPDCVLYYDFSEGTGTTLHDKSASGFNGAISNGSWY